MSIRLLIVDDEAVIRNLLKRHYLAMGYDVEIAADGREALNHLDLAKFDIVITDLLMPNMDGMELLARIREEYPLVRVIVMTGAVSIDNMLGCLKEGAFTFVTKPLDPLQPLDDAVNIAAWIVQGWLEQLTKLQRLKTQTAGNPIP